MSQILGRPVHLDHASLNLLPFPSLTLTHLVIDDLPPFGLEPMVQANSVNARLRLLPLWRHHVEFSRITFDEPSVNLVRLADGRWNLESLLLQAAHIDAAPTAPHSAGRQPRFPYIAATGARLNLKFDQVKSPYSLTETDFALWLPQSQEWKIRLRGHPSRTDTAASDTGVIQVETALRTASTIDSVPLATTVSWIDAPLGEASRIILGHDADVRGTLHISASLDGTLGQARLTGHVGVSDLHRVDILPTQPVEFEVACHADLIGLLRTVKQFACISPVPDSATPIHITGQVPDVLDVRSASVLAEATHLPASTALHWIHAASGRLPKDLKANGDLQAQIKYDGSRRSTSGDAKADELALSTSQSEPPVIFGPIHLQARLSQSQAQDVASDSEASLAPTTIRFAQQQTGPRPDELAFSLGADAQGLSGRLAGRATARELNSLASMLPIFDTGLTPKDEGAAALARDLDFQLHKPWHARGRWTDLSPSPHSFASDR